MGLVYLVAISLLGLLLLAVVWDAIASVSRRQHWPDIRMDAQRVQPDARSDLGAELAVAAVRDAAAPVKVIESGQRVARNDEVAEAA